MDRIDFGSLKKANNTASDNWMWLPDEKVMSTYDVASITKTVVDVVVTEKNFTAGFTATETWPVNTGTLREDDFLLNQFSDSILNTPLQR